MWLSGVDKTTISQLERGLRLAKPITIKKLCDALEVKPRDLLEPHS